MVIKRIWLFLATAAAALLLMSCEGTKTLPESSGFTVSIEEGEGFRVEENGLTIRPGESASFTIRTKSGYMVTGADYPGTYTLHSLQNGIYRLTVTEVNYPARIRLNLTDKIRLITYDANGGRLSGDITALSCTTNADNTCTFSCDVSGQQRPNTETGQNLFVRDGYTLVSWNTMPDGSGSRIGLGSRVTIPGTGITLYAQWACWSPISDFSYRVEEKNLSDTEKDGIQDTTATGGRHIVITRYKGSADTVVIPETIASLPVEEIDTYAFLRCKAETIILPKSLKTVKTDAFASAALTSLVLYDNIEAIPDSAFTGCRNLSTLYINVMEPHYGYYFRRESVYANKMDLLISSQGKRKIVFYGGCSMWYNLDGPAMQEAVGPNYQVINLGLNGLSSSIVQMEILLPFLESGDIFFHTPELSSAQQLLTNREMSGNDDKIWAGVEYNYDLFRNVDIRDISGVFDSLTLWLDKKDLRVVKPPYRTDYEDESGNHYLDETGSIAFLRDTPAEKLVDETDLDLPQFREANLTYLAAIYRKIAQKGVLVYISGAVINIDNVPEENQGNVFAMNTLFRQKFGSLPGVTAVISNLQDFVYHSSDMYDTNYHMLSVAQTANTKIWIRDLLAQMEKDGLTDPGYGT